MKFCVVTEGYHNALFLRSAMGGRWTARRPSPWEQGMVGAALGFRPLLRPTLPLLAAPPLPPLPRDCAHRVPPGVRVRELGVAEELVPKRLRKQQQPYIQDKIMVDNVVREWAAFLCEVVGTDSVNLGASFAKGDQSFDVDKTVGMILAGKQRSTLEKRLGALKRYAKFCVTSGKQAFPLSEPTAFEYLTFLADGPPTSASTFRSAVGFTLGYFALAGAQAVLTSSRCSGAVFKGLRRKRPTKRAKPLTVDQLVELEQGAASAADPRDRILCGFCAFCVHARLRGGDALRIQVEVEPCLDLPPGSGLGYEYAETCDHKTAARGARDLLPLVALADGLTSRSWAAAWIEARQSAGLSANASGCLQPALGHDGGWAVTRMSVNDLTRWLRGFLRDELVSTRSFKPTLLAWAARNGKIPRGLGGCSATTSSRRTGQ